MLAPGRGALPLHPPFAVHPPPGDLLVVTGWRHRMQAS